MSNITLQMHKSKSLQVLLTFWAMRQALGYPLPVLSAVWELPEASFHHQPERSCLGLLTGLQPASYPLYPVDRVTTENQKSDSSWSEDGRSCEQPSA